MNMRVPAVWLATMVLVQLLTLCQGLDFVCAETGIISVEERDLPRASIFATGKGFPPERDISATRKKLLTKRAATLDAYRILAATLKGVSGYIADGNGYIQTSGYIRGAEVSNVRYFTDGKVEVDLILPVNFRTAGSKDWNSIMSDISGRGYPVCYSEGQAKQITEEEWLKLRGME